MTPDEGGRKKPCVADMQLMCFSKTWDCSSFMTMVDKDMAMPGEDATIELKMVKPMMMGFHLRVTDCQCLERLSVKTYV